jgi:putative ABC transport system permease protein
MKPALPWSTAARIAWRELRAGKAKFLFVVLSVAVGVAALTGVRGFSDSFSRALLEQARSILAADVSARMFRQPTAQEAQQLQALEAKGVRETAVTETLSMAMVKGDPIPLLVSLKAVNPDKYPFYGTVILSAHAGSSAQKGGPSLRDALTNGTVVVDDNLLVRLRANVGDELKIGDEWFRIAAVIEKEPDRLTAGVGLGPRVMMTRVGLDRSGLLQPGSRANERYLFAVESKQNIDLVKTEVEKILPGAQVTDFREASPELTRGLDHATGLLSLICLVAMVLGAIGVAMAMRAHLQQRIEILAIMKSVGARSADILRIYLLQTLFLGVTGALIGIGLGLGVEYALPVVLGKLLPLHPAIRLPLDPVLAALGTGVLTTVLFCLPPLLDVRRVRPILVLRRTVESGNGGNLGAWVWEHKLQIVSILVILGGLGGIAAGLADSVLVGKWFTVCLAGVLAVLLGLSAATLRGLRAFLSRTRLRLHSVLRHGLSNLYRPGNQSAAVLAALGAGVMLILSVFLMQRSIVESLHEDVKPETPNVFLVDMSTDELPGIRALLGKQKGVVKGLETIPVVAARVESIDGTPVDQLKLKNYPKRMLRSANLSWSETVPEGTKLAEGKWWASGSPDADLAVVDRVAQRLHLHVGTPLTFVAGQKTLDVKVAAIYRITGEHPFARSEFVMPEALLAGQPVVWYGDIHARADAIPNVERALFAAYPTVTVINIADIVETIQGVVDQITLVIRFLAGFSILSGLIILASSVAGTRFRRIREVVVLKTLGATRRRIAAVFSVEFAVLGLLAGAVGVLFANLLTHILLHHMDLTFHRDVRGSVAAVAATAVLAVATGWIASWRILGQKPLEVLRDE